MGILILIGSWKANWLMTVFATTGVILAAVYLLYMFRRVFYGEITHEANKALPDLNRLELASALPLVVMAFFMGIFPTVFLSSITPDSQPIVQRINVSGGTFASEAQPPLLSQALPDVLLGASAEGGTERGGKL